MSLLAHSAEDPADNRAYLLNNGTAGRYRSAVTESVTRVSAKIAGTTRPFTGVTVDGLTPTVSGVDLDAPCTTRPPRSTNSKRSTSATPSTSTTHGISRTSTALW